MTYKAFGVALILGAAIALPDIGDAFTSKRGARVNPVNDIVFEVVPRNSGSGEVIWCAAADYAQRELRAPWQARIYVVRGRGPSVTTGRRTAVQFTLDPTAAGVTPITPSLSLNSLQAGDNMTVQNGHTYCQRSIHF